MTRQPSPWAILAIGALVYLVIIALAIEWTADPGFRRGLADATPIIVAALIGCLGGIALDHFLIGPYVDRRAYQRRSRNGR